MKPTGSARRERRRAHRPAATTDEQAVWVCLTPATARAIARIAARREVSLCGYRDHPARLAVGRPLRVCAATAAEWRRDAWQAVDKGLIGVDDARALAAQIDPPEVP